MIIQEFYWDDEKILTIIHEKMEDKIKNRTLIEETKILGHEIIFKEFHNEDSELEDFEYNFLIEAKKQTYANEIVKKQLSSRKGSYDYEYSSNNMTYHDTYFGGTNFMGEEVVYLESDTPIWGMNYYGVTLDQSLSEEAVDKALRPALMQVGSDNIIPVRGPKEYIDGVIKKFSDYSQIRNLNKVPYQYVNLLYTIRNGLSFLSRSICEIY